MRMPYADQGSFAAALEEVKFSPFVLPLNWNFRPNWQLSFFGPVKIWHDYAELPPFFDEMRKYYNQPEAIIQYHAAMRVGQVRRRKLSRCLALKLTSCCGIAYGYPLVTFQGVLEGAA
jgi:hypothetical protein